jgi:hypothetical protein
MERTNRREMIALAGATALLAGCGAGKNSDSKAAANGEAEIQQHDDPTGDPVGAPNNDGFRYYKLIVLKMVGNSLDATYASFEANPNWTDGEALDAVRSKIASAPTGWNGDVGRLSGIAGNSLGSAFDLRTFGFGAKHRVYFYCYGAGMKFPKQAKNAITFKLTNDSPWPVQISDNKSFYRAKVLDYSNQTPKDQKILYIENHYKDRNGPLKKPTYYSFDLFFETTLFVDPNRASSKTLLPKDIETPPTLKMTIDPTTGNGNTWDPMTEPVREFN